MNIMSTLRSIGLATLLYTAFGSFAAPSVTLEPSKAIISVGETVFVDVFVADAEDLFGLQFDLGFTSAVGQSLNVAGLNLLSDGSTFFDGILGADEVQFISETVVGAQPGFTGAGLFARWTLLGTSAGALQLSINDVLALDSSLFEIGGISTRGASIEVLATSPIPEPGTLALAMLGLVALRCLGARPRAPAWERAAY
jgi:hypothetical protein